MALKISHHRHSGRLLPHHHTSYGGLSILLGFTTILALLVTLSFGQYGHADTDSTAITIGELVVTPPPTVAPHFISPVNGLHVDRPQLGITGTCTPGLFVAVQGSGASLGSAACADTGTFSLTVSLQSGTTILTARQYDGLGQSGPVSPSVTVIYQLPVSTPPAGSIHNPITNQTEPSPPLVVTAPYRFSYIQPNDPFLFTGKLAGGVAPYAIQIDWGDRAQTLLSRIQPGIFSVYHTYGAPGNYAIKLTTTDSAGATSVYQTVVVANGIPADAAQPNQVPSVGGASSAATDGGGMIVWPLLFVVLLVIISFWLGERYDRHKLAVSELVTPT